MTITMYSLSDGLVQLAYDKNEEVNKLDYTAQSPSMAWLVARMAEEILAHRARLQAAL